ncbi:MAG: CHAT domain-containing protein [Candidatus Competibacteraceae bacterium]|nr:CHAT domain-containing protein [Candidatus Competibacteraceae bacterium]
MSPTVVVLVLLLLLPLALPAGADQSSPTADQAYAQSIDALRRGDFAQAVQAAQTARTAFVNVGNHQQQLAALLRMAEAYQGLGQPRAARQVLHEAQLLAVNAPLALQAEILAARGQADWLSGEWDAAQPLLREAVEIARRSNDHRSAALALNTLGNRAASVGDPSAARAYYEQALAAVADDDATLRVRIQLNAARAAWREGKAALAESGLQAALPMAERLPPSHDKVFNLLALGQLLRELPSASSERQATERLFTEAGELALTLGDARSASYAWGYRGQSAAGAHRDAEALALSRRAVTLAQQAQAPESLYRWQWQIGRLLQRQGDRDGAVLAYRQAALNLQSVRHEITADQRDRTHSFRDGSGVLLVELADLLLQRASQTSDSPRQQRDLIAARDTMEQLKTAELRDYFQDDCVIEFQGDVAPVDQLSPGTAALYPILLPDRTELLLSLPDGIHQYQAPVGSATVTQTVREFRKALEKRTTYSYPEPAQRLYGWLIAPLEPELHAQKIDTLVIIPDGLLRTIPFAALYDGQHFLIERYALATTPGLTLTHLQARRRRNNRLLLNGLSQSVQGFPALQQVESELSTLSQMYKQRKILKNEDFTVINVNQTLASEPYSIVHIASHGQFDREVDKTFLLTFDSKLTLDQLEQLLSLTQYRGQPVDLLTLSACQTAAGDDRAALGLAGVAVKAGAGSVLATLWFVNDKAAALLISTFYQRLQNPKLSKAKALQQAQQLLLQDNRYDHPGYWAAFLMIGNWL